MLGWMWGNTPQAAFKRNVGWKLIRATRVGFLGLTLYSTGFLNGVSAFSKDPEGFRKELVDSVLAETGATRVLCTTSRDHQRASDVAQRIVTAARKHFDNQLKEVNQLHELRTTELETLKNPSGEEDSSGTERALVRRSIAITEAEASIAKHADTVTELKDTLKTCDLDWKCMVTDAPSVNAFVSPLIPGVVFIHQGLLDEVANEHELGLILGHELSHSLLNHGDDRLIGSALLAGTELVTLAFVDPVGILSFFLSRCISRLSTYTLASYSREHEHEADAFGVKLAAMACFDTPKGAEIFKLLAAVSGEEIREEGARTGSDSAHSWDATHPSTEERYTRVTELSKVEASANVTECSKYQAALRVFRGQLPSWLTG